MHPARAGGGGGAAAHSKAPPAREEEIVRQLEFYFGDDNYAKDEYLRSLADAEGWVELQAVCDFRQMQKLRAGPEHVKYALRCLPFGSRVVELDSGRGRLIRRRPFMQRLARQVEFYLSDANWPTDQHMQQRAALHGGAFPLNELVGFRMMRTMFDREGVAGDVRVRTECVLDALERWPAEGVELSPDCAGVLPAPTDTCVKQLVEHYFSDANLAYDEYMRELLAESHDGFVAISELMRWPRIHTMIGGKDVAAVATMISGSSVLEVSADGAYVRRVGGHVHEDVHEDRSAGTPSQSVPPSPQDCKFGFACTRLDCSFLHRSGRRIDATSTGGSSVHGVGPSSAPRQNCKFGFKCKRPDCIYVHPAGREIDSAVVTKTGNIPARWFLMPALDPCNAFSVLQFNILADYLCMTPQHGYAPRTHRVWSYRQRLLYSLLNESSASVICLQEVQPDHYVDIEAELGSSGYVGLYSPKIGTDGVEQPAFMNKTIGNAIFYRNDVFEARDEGGEVVAFAPLLNEHCKDDVERAHYCRGGQVAVVRHLWHRSSGRSVLVACTHISANWQNPDTQLAQAVVLTQALRKLQAKFGSAKPEIVLCGDFNSKPDSGAYDFLSSGSLDPHHPHARPVPRHISPLTVLRGGPTHTLDLASAYCTVDGNEPSITNITGSNQGRPGFKDCLDYVWHSRSLVPSAVAPLPSEARLKSENGGLPNSWCPSDHLPLGVVFQFRQ